MADHVPMSLLLFRLGDLNCAVPVRSVREIVPQGMAARIPGASVEVEGLLNVRGRLVTVVDGRRALKRTEQPGTEPSILLVESNGRSVGLIVDEVSDLVTVPADSLDEGADLPGVDARLVRAVGRWAGQVFVLLDTDAVLAPVFGR